MEPHQLDDNSPDPKLEEGADSGIGGLAVGGLMVSTVWAGGSPWPRESGSCS